MPTNSRVGITNMFELWSYFQSRDHLLSECIGGFADCLFRNCEAKCWWFTLVLDVCHFWHHTHPQRHIWNMARLEMSELFTPLKPFCIYAGSHSIHKRKYWIWHSWKCLSLSLHINHCEYLNAERGIWAQVQFADIQSGGGKYEAWSVWKLGEFYLRNNCLKNMSF